MALDEVLVQRETEAGAVGDWKAAVGVDPRLLHQHLAERGSRPAGWLVRELKPGRVRDRRDKMQVGEQADPMRPGVRRQLESGCFGQGCDFSELVHALRKNGIWLQDVVTGPFDQELEFVNAVVVLAACEL